MKPLRFQDESNMDAYVFVAAEEEDTHEPFTYQEAIACEYILSGKLLWMKRWIKACIDYNEVFSLVLRHTSIRVILALTACKDYELEQLDVKTAFLHRNLDEVIYMRQPPRYEQGNKHDNKRKADDSSRNNQQQQPHKKQNVARAYTVGPSEKKVYTGDLPMCTKCNYHHTGQCAPKCGKCKRYGHTTMDRQVNTNNNNNNNNKNQKAGACYKCGNIRHIKKNCPNLKNCVNGSDNGVAQGRAYALRGRDASPDSNVITGTFLLNNRYAKILFDSGADRSFVATTFSGD
nr:hypothetical protein [Tanacetum cinerariifolium]